jgi:hypothetical protein
MAKKSPKAKRKTEVEATGGVIKRSFSIPKSLYDFAVAKASRIAKGRRPSVSAYLSGLIFADKTGDS